MGQGASPEQSAADAGRPPARLRLLAPVAPAGQRGVERPGLQVHHVRCGQVGSQTLSFAVCRIAMQMNKAPQSSENVMRVHGLLDYCIRMVVATVLAQKLGVLF